jgi:hypothetical protein
MTPDELKSGLQKVVDLQKVPSRKFGRMIQRTLLGGLLVVLGLVGLAKFAMNHYLVVGLVLLGATTWSQQLITGSLKALLKPFAAYRRAVRRRDDDDDDDYDFTWSK